MKHAYVGDIRDFEKYSVLRALSRACGLALVVCWMLTADDGGGDGRKLEYLLKPERYRHLDPHVFDRLRDIVRAGNRRVDAVEAAGVLERARFFRRELRSGTDSRESFFTGLWEEAENPSLLFFDPDTGLAPATARRHRSNAVRYIFDEELAEAYRRGHSVVLFDHFKHVSWPDYLPTAFARLRATMGAPGVFAVYSTGVALIVMPQPDAAQLLTSAGETLAARWSPHLRFRSH